MATDTGFTYYYFLNYHFRTFITVSLIDGGCLKGRQFKEGSTVVVCLSTNHSKMLGCLQSWLKCCFAQWWNSFINDVMKNKTGDKIKNNKYVAIINIKLISKISCWQIKVKKLAFLSQGTADRVLLERTVDTSKHNSC